MNAIKLGVCTNHPSQCPLAASRTLMPMPQPDTRCTCGKPLLPAPRTAGQRQHQGPGPGPGPMPQPGAAAAAVRTDLAGRAARLGAAFLDSLFYLCALSPVLIVTPAAGTLRMRGGFEGLLLLTALLLTACALTVLVVFQLMLLSRNGQTLGKRALDIRIVRSSGERASLGRIVLLRWLLPVIIEVIPWLGWLVALADAGLIFMQDRRTLHDRIADTIVVQDAQPFAAAAPDKPMPGSRWLAPATVLTCVLLLLTLLLEPATYSNIFSVR